MRNEASTLIDLETRFWQSLVDGQADVALEMLCEPSMMVSEHGAMKFDHAAYRKMAEQGTQVVRSFDLSDMVVAFPSDTTAVLTYHVKQVVAGRTGGKAVEQQMNDSSTWIKDGSSWKCALHTESPAAAR